MLFINLENENVLGGEAKGQLISEWIFWWISALESKNWLNWKDKCLLYTNYAN